MAYATQADLENAVGGSRFLLQLADFNQTDSIGDAGVQAVISGWLEDAAAEIRSRALVKHTPEVLAALDSVSLRRVIDVNATLAARAAFEKGTGGLAMPEGLASRAQRCDQWLLDLSEGRAVLGRAANTPEPALRQTVGVIDPDPNGTALSMTGLRTNGFR